MKVLVTGGAGFIGSHVAEYFVREGHEVTVVDNMTSGNFKNIPTGVYVDYVDICDETRLHQVFLCRRPDVVIHLAAQVSVRESVKDPHHDAYTNILGTVNVLRLAHLFGCKQVVLASSGGAIYSEPLSKTGMEEFHPILPASPYGVSKYCMEQYGTYYSRCGMPVVSLRFANVYGPRQDPHGEAGVIAIFINQLLNGIQTTIYGTGEQVRDFVYVSDVVDAIAAVVERCPVPGPYNVGTGKGTTIKSLHALLAQTIGVECEPVYTQAKPGEQMRSLLSSQKIHDNVKWSPKVSLVEGLLKTVNWTKENDHV